MGIVFRQSIKATLVIFSGVVLGAAFTFLSAQVIPLQELGGSRIMIAQASVLQLALLMGTGSLVQTFSQRYSNDDPRKPVLVTLSLLTPIMVTMIVSIPYYLLKGYIVSRYQQIDRPFLNHFYWWVIALTLLQSYITLLEHYLASQYKVASSIFMREVVLRICMFGLLGAYYFGWIDFSFFVYGMVAVHLIPLALLFVLASRTDGFFISRRWLVFSKADYREIIHYAWYHMLTGVSLNVLSFIDVLLLGPLSPAGLADVAIYTTAQFFIAILAVPYRAMAGAAFPKLNEAWLNGDNAELSSLFNRAGLNMLIVATGMWLVVCSNMHNAVSIFRPEFAPLLPIVLILSCGRMADMSTGLNTELISVTMYYRFNFRMSLLLLVCVIVLDRICIPRWGVYGAAWVASGALIAFNVVKMIFLYVKTGLSPFSKGTAGIILAGVLTYLANLLLPKFHNPFVDATLRATLIVVIYTALLLLFRPSPDLSHYISQIRKNKRLF